MRDAAKGLRKLGVELDLLLTSPLVRAVETGEIVATALALPKKHIRQTANLVPEVPADQLFAELKSRAGIESVALVGHQPDLGNLISRLIQRDGAPLSIQLKKGGICCINVTETVPTLRGDLMWLLTPKQLRLIAKA
jgi:phosphohistidine phosphatase